jgi:hypothetical protein
MYQTLARPGWSTCTEAHLAWGAVAPPTMEGVTLTPSLGTASAARAATAPSRNTTAGIAWKPACLMLAARRGCNPAAEVKHLVTQ